MNINQVREDAQRLKWVAEKTGKNIIINQIRDKKEIINHTLDFVDNGSVSIGEITKRNDGTLSEIVDVLYRK